MLIRFVLESSKKCLKGTSKRDLRIASVYCLLSVLNCWRVAAGLAAARGSSAVSTLTGLAMAPRKRDARGRRAKNFMMTSKVSRFPLCQS